MLTPSQRARILQHLEHGWKLPDSLVHDLWAAYEYLEGREPAGDRAPDDADSAVRREGAGRDRVAARG